MAINFPDSPTEDEEFTVGSTTWIHKSGKWVLKPFENEPGEQGPPGADGLGVPAGGMTGQFLAKASNADNDTEWADVDALPPQTGNAGKILTTDGSESSWQAGFSAAGDADISAAGDLDITADNVNISGDFFVNGVRIGPLAETPPIVGAASVSPSFIGEEAIYDFTSTGSITLDTPGYLQYLIVGGGGGGGSGFGCGGGGGGFTIGSMVVPAGTYTVTVGNGGAAGSNDGNGGKGGNSSFYTVTMEGGGFGSGYSKAGGSGGSGGGGNTAAGVANNPLYGNNGGVAWPAGGGGAGGAASGATPGVGVVSLITGSSITFAAGGNTGQGVPAANTGSGGGGGGWSGKPPGRAGATGRVVLRMAASTPSSDIPVGGTTGQLLAKASEDNFDTEWVDPPSGEDGVTTLAALLDVDLTGAVNGNALVLEDGTWVPGAGGGGGGGGGATGGGTDEVFYENDTNVTANYTITSGKNAMTAGPVTVDSGVTVTIPSGSVWTVV